MDCSTSDFPVHHQLLEPTQTHVHRCRWCHPTISFSVIPFSSYLQSLPALGSFPVNQFIASGGLSIGMSVSASVLPMNIQDCFSLGWTGWISLQSKGLSRVFSNPTVPKHQFFGAQLSLWSSSRQSVSSVAQLCPTLCDPMNHRMSSSHIHTYQPRGGHFSPRWSHIWGGPTWKGRKEAGFLLMSLSCWIYLRPTLPMDFILCDIINSFVGLQNHCRWWLQPWN